jgi:hypothetical protein
MKSFILLLLFLFPSLIQGQNYTISGNYTYGISVFDLDKTSFYDLRKERRFTPGYSYGLSIGKFYKSGYYQKKFWGVKLEFNKFQYAQNIRLVPESIPLTSLKFIEKRIQVDGYSITPTACYYPSVGQSLFVEFGPSFNHISQQTQSTVSNTVGFDSPLVPYEFKKNFLSLYLRSGVYFNLTDWLGFNIALFSKTNITPVVEDNTFRSYFFGVDGGLTFRIGKWKSSRTR